MLPLSGPLMRSLASQPSTSIWWHARSGQRSQVQCCAALLAKDSQLRGSLCIVLHRMIREQSLKNGSEVEVPRVGSVNNIPQRCSSATCTAEWVIEESMLGCVGRCGCRPVARAPTAAHRGCHRLLGGASGSSRHGERATQHFQPPLCKCW